MKIPKLRETLIELRVNPRAVGIEGIDTWDDQYRLEKGDLGWAVYYAERGETVGRRDFFNEDDACDYFLSLVEKDPTTRLRR